jgi:hypothetical protein
MLYHCFVSIDGFSSADKGREDSRSAMHLNIWSR